MRRICLVALLFVPASLSAGELSVERFRALHKELQPPKDDCCLSIPWKIDLLAAQKIAAENKKPLFIWAMDGHPLGCT